MSSPGAAPAPASGDDNDDDIAAFRLPVIVKPTHYDVTYRRIDFETPYSFEGTVSIACKGAAPESNGDGGGGGGDKTSGGISIKLHAIEIQFLKATLHKKKNGAATSDSVVGFGDDDVQKDQYDFSLDAVSFRSNIKEQTCTIVFENGGDGEERRIAEGDDYVLVIDFMGTLNDQMHGFYRSTYTGLDGLSRKVMATTQFEATDARRAFPCFDEPALKASFRVAVTIPSHLTAISNTPVESCHTDATTTAKKTITFQPTPTMSTYLLALVIGEFDCISKTSNHVVTTVYTVPGKARQGQFCLDTAVRCLDYYRDLYGIEYPLPKSDLLAIPDFAAGAMENVRAPAYSLGGALFVTSAPAHLSVCVVPFTSSTPFAHTLC